MQNIHPLVVLKSIFQIIGVTFALVAAILRWRASSLGTAGQDSAKAWFYQKWKRIDSSKWLEMPGVVMNWYVSRQQAINKYLYRSFQDQSWTCINILILFIVSPIITGVSLGMNNGRYYGISIFVIMLVIPPSLIILAEILYRKSHVGVWLTRWLILALFWMGHGAGALLWMKFSLNLPTLLSLIVSGFIALIYSPILTAPLPLRPEDPSYAGLGAAIMDPFGDLIPDPPDPGEYYRNFLPGLSITASFGLTYFALLLGKVIHPFPPVERTAQLLISNIICDSLTVMLTFWILSNAMSSRRRLGIPFAISLIICLAGILAFISLWIGLAFTTNELSLSEVTHVFLGKSVDGLQWEFGPYFWVMHTTFIPTLVYVVLLLIVCMGKLVLSIINIFFGKGKAHNNPLDLTAALFGLIAAIFGLFVVILGFF